MNYQNFGESDEDTSSFIEKDPASFAIDRKINLMFAMVGIPFQNKGCNYLREAIKLTYKKPTVLNSVMKELYPAVARIFNTAATLVERGIRYEIGVACRSGKMLNLNKMFNFAIADRHYKPSNSEFIALFCEKLNMDSIIYKNPSEGFMKIYD